MRFTACLTLTLLAFAHGLSANAQETPKEAPKNAAKAADEGAEKVLPTGRTKSGLPPEGYTDTELIPGQKYRVHDKDRPEPSIVDPGTAATHDRNAVIFNSQVV